MTTMQPVSQRGNALAVQNAKLFDIEGPIPAGQFCFYVSRVAPGEAGLLFGCPCGCGQMHSVGFDTHEQAPPRWAWNGDREKPTLTPSINILQSDENGNHVGEHWHGFLTDGEFRSC